MSSTPSVRRSALDLREPECIRELREVLRAGGFDGEGVRSALGAESALLSRLADVPVHERRLRGVEPLGPLIRLFVLDAPMRQMFGLPLGEDAALAPLRRWRDDLYRRHRGGRVAPE